MWPINPFLPYLCSEEVSRMEDSVERFETAWRDGAAPDPAAFLPPDGPRLATLIELVAVDGEYRRAAGHDADAHHYVRRFPELAAVRALGTVGRYELVAEVGAGSFGRVYRATDPTLGRTVAVKIPHAGRFGASDRERVLREARCCARLRHPNIVPLHEVLEHDGLPALVSAFVEGRPLSEWAGTKPVAPRVAAGLIADLAGALHYAHGAGVVHRDVKPSNVLIDAAGRPHLLDFGLAKQDAAETLTVDGELLGTPAYMAPEQARGVVADARADVYSLGVVFYELLTGERPFRGTARAVLTQIAEVEPVPPRRLVPELPRDLETVCLKAMARAPADRYATASAFADDVRRWVRGEPVVARPVGLLGRLRRWCRRRPIPAALTAALLLSVVGGVVGMGWQWSRVEERRQEAERNADRAERNADRAAHERDQVEEQERMTREVLEDLLGLGPLRLTPDPNRTRPTPVEIANVQKAVKYFQHLVERRPNDPEVLYKAATVYTAAGHHQFRQEELDAARASQEAALALLARLRAIDPANFDYRVIEARTFYRLASVHESAGRHGDAVAPAVRACEGFAALLTERPDEEYCRHNLNQSFIRLDHALMGALGPSGTIRRLRDDGWLTPPTGEPSVADVIRARAMTRSAMRLAGQCRRAGDREGETIAIRAVEELCPVAGLHLP